MMAKIIWNGIEYDGCERDGNEVVLCRECGGGEPILSPRCIHGNCCFHCEQCDWKKEAEG